MRYSSAKRTCLAACVVLMSSVCAQTAGTWAGTGSLNGARRNIANSTVLLQNGKVLTAGGMDNAGAYLVSAELYDPVTGTWTLTGNLANPRYNAVARLLASGKVLLVGGANTSYVVACELYDPVAGTWSATGNPATCRDGSLTVLADGKVLVSGGNDAGGTVIANCELYDPVAGTWSPTGNMAAARRGHASTLLSSGKVLVAGGEDGAGGYLNGAEIYDPVAGTWSATGSLTTARVWISGSVLPGGKVLVAAGKNASGNVTSAELFDPIAGTWSAAGNISAGRTYLPPDVVLSDGRVVIAGGWNTSIVGTTDVYDPVSNTWSASGSMVSGRCLHANVLLPAGQVLTFGGRDVSWAVTNSAELYESGTGSGAGGGVANIADGQPAVANPLNGMSMRVARSSGGYIELEIDIQALNRAAFSVRTSFDGIAGRQATVDGLRPSHRFTEHGIFVATAIATDTATGQEKGRARKTLVLSKNEIGTPQALIDNRTSSAIAMSKLKGKFAFRNAAAGLLAAGASAARPDTVAFSGKLNLPGGLDFTQEHELWIAVGNIVDRVTVGAKGKPKLPSTLGRITRFKAKLPRLTDAITKGDEEAQVDFTLALADMSEAGFDTEGVSEQATGADKTPVERQVQVAVVLSGVAYQSSAPALFKTSKVNKTTNLPECGTLTGMSRSIR